MAIVTGGDAGLREDSFGNFISGITDTFSRIVDGFTQIAKLGDTANSLPKENVYVDDGFQNVPGSVFSGSGNLGAIDDIQKRRITSQTPDLTIYIKKRMFWALRNEHDSKFMDAGEKLYFRASKILFERKCSQIAAYEALTKLERLVQEESDFDVAMLEIVIDSLQEFLDDHVDDLEEQALAAVETDPNNIEFNEEIVFQLTQLKQDAGKLEEAIKSLEDLKRQARKTKNAVHTTWVVDTEDISDPANLGRGQGVIELTLVDSINTSLSLEYQDKGSFNFTVENPYNLLSISASEIEMAVKSAFLESRRTKDSALYNPNNFLGPQHFLDSARDKDAELKRARNNRLINVSNPLTSTDNSEIVFEINASSSAPYRVTGRVGATSEPFHKDNYRIVLAQIFDPEVNLTLEEDNLVRIIFDLLERYVTEIDKISATELGELTPEDEGNIKYTRRQLRKLYLGKNLIQPMDGVNVYMRGNTFRDNDVIGPLNYLLNASPFVQSFGGEANEEALLEEMAQFGLDSLGISVDLYRVIRTGSLLRNAGTHVFGGLVSSVEENYNASQGKYVLNITGESNLKWLGLSRINTTPSLDQAQGLLEDPLTPFDIEVDDATGLVTGVPQLTHENRRLLSEGKIIFDKGAFRGAKAEETTLVQDIRVLDNSAIGVVQHAPGLKYRWKEGVIVSSREVNLRTALNGESPAIDKLRRDVGVNVVNDPFANLDVADVVSLLVTGIPHNYETFMINSNSVGTFTPGQANSPESFFHSFIDITRSQNRALGNFEPFKFYRTSRKSMANRLQLQTDLRQDNKKLINLRSEIAKLQDQLNQLALSEEIRSGETDAGNINRSKSAQDVQSRLSAKKTELDNLNRDFTEKLKDGEEQGLRVYGNDIIFDDTATLESAVRQSVETDSARVLSAKFLQMRPQLSTKYNRDTNLFVVSDDYDKDTDLQAFVINLASGEIPIWNSQYKHPFEICINAAKVIDFEFFCDTQGHIQFRSPKYNKVPLSLLAKMLLLSDKKEVELVSPFVRNLFESRENSLAVLSESLTIEIEIQRLLLNLSPGTINQVTDNSAASNLFIFSLIDGSVPSLSSSASNNAAESIKNNRNKLAELFGTLSVSNDETDVEKIQQEIHSYQDPKEPNVNTNRATAINKLLQLVSQKQKVDDTLKKVQERQENFTAGLANSDTGFYSIPTQEQIKTFKNAFGDMIEDDYNDFLGPGSSKRFIIYDDQIINYSFKESDQNVVCRVDVTGQEDFIGEGPGTIGGIPWIWAGATDFDLWKQYGWRADTAESKPFFKSGALQCAPYALMLLARNRKNIIRATVTVAGNEYYQLGDVVYINSKDLLFYVNGVRHSFSTSSGAFTTTLDLRYGHALGEFIPTPLDVIGKNLIKNQRNFNTTLVNRRTAGNDIGRLAGVVLFPGIDINTDPGAAAGFGATGSSEEELNTMLSGGLGLSNLLTLKNALLRINSQKHSPQFANVELRTFSRGDLNSLSSEKLRARMEAIKEWLINPIAAFTENDNAIQLRPEDFPPLDPSNIKSIDSSIDPVLLTADPQESENIGRTPREESYNIASDDLERVVEIIIKFKDL